jgi:hypothetical protein
MFYTANEIKLIEDEILKALESLGKKHNVEFRFDGGRYEPRVCRSTLVMSVIGEDGNAANPDADEFKRSAHLYGLKPEFLGKEFLEGRSRYTIIGLKPTRRKTPILCVNQNGKRYLVPVNTVLRGLGLPMSNPFAGRF